MSAAARLLAIGTAAPRTELTPGSSLGLARLLCPGDDAERLGALYAGAGVSRRGSVVVDGGGCQDLFTPGEAGGPTTATRLARYRAAAGDLAAEASARALTGAEVEPGSVTHLVTVSCTGAQSPGLDHDLIERLGLSQDISRTHVGFMGCHGALNGLAVACAHVRADAGATAMVVCAEVCSLHYHVGGSWDQQVANAIFADGGACAVVGRREAGPAVRAFGSRVFPRTRELMSWSIGDRGFEMRLSPRVPSVLRRNVGGWIDEWLGSVGLGRADVAHWAVHPGGRDILEGVRQGLGLSEESLTASRGVLDSQGNMSSGTVLWVLDALLRSGSSGLIAALAFGPGLTGEAMLLEVAAGR